MDIDAEIDQLLDELYSRYSYDFRNYTRASVRRRVAAALIHFGLQTVQELRNRVSADPEMFLGLIQFMTVPVTEMFRDPAYYRAIREHVIPHLATYPSLKIWIAGCSTGEEAYSFAILLEEEGLLDRSLIYATDINPRSLRTAEAGVYSVDQVRKWTTNYQQAGGKLSLSDYYTAAYENVAFHARLRRNLLFTDHSLATDHVFAEVQFVSCRNVMIYFDRGLQNRSLGLFYDSLSHRGFLGIGDKESLRFTAYSHVLEPWVSEERLFRKVQGRARH